ISEARMALVPLACEVLRALLRRLKPHEIAISSYGIREGMLYEQMPDELRHRDPLIEACRFAEDKDARQPGFGPVLDKFLAPLFRSVPVGRRRVIKAACLLHDVSWRAHPDYRHEVCFDNVTRASLGGLTHSGRIFLGLALLHRYKNSRSGTRFEPLFDLLSEKDIAMAEVLGKGLRFSSMLAADDADLIGELRWFPKKKKLELRLPKRAMGLFGEVAEARFQALAEALGGEPVVKQIRASA
ncbi:MAG: exopolyphosphatase, partial [Rhodobacter sp.]|nr:exopolyphosphatase [Rhodobacter sp.]